MTTFPSPDRPPPEGLHTTDYSLQKECVFVGISTTKREALYIDKCNSCKTWYHQSCLKIKNYVIMIKSINFCVISVSFNDIVYNCFLIHIFCITILCIIIMHSWCICRKGTPNPEEDTELQCQWS